MKQVSIIIPVYNAEKFLERCILSIIKQTYKNIEIILVNDGSRDNSLSVLKKYEKQYSFIKVFDQKNSGPAAARNKGLELVEGYYLTFVDSDDYIDTDYIETLVKEIEDNDILISGYRRVNENQNLSFIQSLKEDNWSKFKQLTVWGKLFKTSIIKKNNISFKNLKIHEDAVFCINAYCKTKKIKITNYVGYNNYENINSISNNVKVKKENDVIEVFNIIEKEVINEKFIKENRVELVDFYLKTFTFFLIDNSRVLNFEELKEYYSRGICWIKSFCKRKTLKFHWKHQKSESLKVNVAVKLSELSYKSKLSSVYLKLLKKVFK